MADARAVIDGPAVRRWAEAGLLALTAARDEIDALNVYPVADSDTGTNLVRTLQACVAALDAAVPGPVAAELEVMAAAALRGSCGNSGTIVSQLLRGLADGAKGVEELDGRGFAAALSLAAELARTALARPVEGTILTVADAAAAGARSAADRDEPTGAVVAAAVEHAGQALVGTPHQLAALGGRLDAGGRGLVVLLAALKSALDSSLDSSVGSVTVARAPQAEVVVGAVPMHQVERGLATSAPGPAHEVMYLLDLPVASPSAPSDPAGADPVAGLRERLAELGDSVVVVGGGQLWQVHAHVDDIGAALEAGLEIGRPHRVRVMLLPPGEEHHPPAESGQVAAASAAVPLAAAPLPSRPGPRLGVVALVEGAGLADLLARAGALVVTSAESWGATDPEASDPAAGAVLTAVTRCGTPTVVLLAAADAGPPSASDLGRMTGLAAGDGIELRVLSLASAVQVIAALAVHDPLRDPARDLLEMATAAAATRHGLVERAEGDGLTSAGWCRPGDVLGHVGGDVAVIGRSPAVVAGQVVDLLLGGGGEVVTLVTGGLAGSELADEVAAGLRARRPDVDVSVYDGGRPSSYLLVGVE